jgi:drug/metabolite transporter (DMT)-like permease
MTRDEAETEAAVDRDAGNVCWTVGALFGVAGVGFLTGGDLSGLLLLGMAGLLGWVAHVSWARADRWLA